MRLQPLYRETEEKDAILSTVKIWLVAGEKPDKRLQSTQGIIVLDLIPPTNSGGEIIILLIKRVLKIINNGKKSTRFDFARHKLSVH